MYTVLLSGGSGKRLWPLSNNSRSKQYIKLLSKEDGSDNCSMVQRVWAQLEEAGLADNSIICAPKIQEEILHNQLGGINIALEPAQRDTFPAVALSCAFLRCKMGAADDDTVCVIPVDPYTDKTYFETVKKLPDVLERSGAQVALMGCRPDCPSSKFGYIVPKQDRDGYFEVDSFTEKPDYESAIRLIQKGAVWNCGVFCLKIGDVLGHCEKYGIAPDYDEMFMTYDRFPRISFDYEVLEKAQKLAAVVFDGLWKDLGTWNTLTDEMKRSTVGLVKTEGCENTFVINELDVPVVAMGVKDMVITASYDGILVSGVEDSVRIKDVVSSLNANPRYEERRWGTVQTAELMEDSRLNAITRKMVVDAGKDLAGSYHSSRDKVWTMLGGEAKLVIDRQERVLRAGDVVRIDANTPHSFTAITDCRVLEVLFDKQNEEQ
ncbi:MAG: cupin domain-containing protein [Ruminococcus sp.]|nr:cupin domain-containing protein [Ruminococcus sp.]